MKRFATCAVVAALVYSTSTFAWRGKTTVSGEGKTEAQALEELALEVTKAGPGYADPVCKKNGVGPVSEIKCDNDGRSVVCVGDLSVCE